MAKPAFEQLLEYRANIIDAGDTRFNRLLQLAESERRERVADALVQLLLQVAPNLVTVLDRLSWRS